ncbi:MAG: Ig-like domain repeat protein [Acidobacteriota bacterium]
MPYLSLGRAARIVLRLAAMTAVAAVSLSSHAQTTFADHAVPVTLVPAKGSQQFFAINQDRTLLGSATTQTSTFALTCPAPTGISGTPSSSTSVVFDDGSRFLFETGTGPTGTNAIVGVGADFSGTTCNNTPVLPFYGSSVSLSAVDHRHQQVLVISSNGPGSPDVITSISTNGSGDYYSPASLSKHGQVSLDTGGTYSAIAPDIDGTVGYTAITQLRTDSSPGGLWIYDPSFNRTVKILGPGGVALPAVNAFIIHNPMSVAGGLLVLTNQDLLTTSNLDAPPPVTTPFTLIDMGQLGLLLQSHPTAASVTLPFVSKLNTTLSYYAIFGSAFNPVDNKLYLLTGSGSSATNLLRQVIRYDPADPTAPAETVVADVTSVPLFPTSLPLITLNAAAGTMQILTTAPNTVYSVNITGTGDTATPVPASTFTDPGFNPTYIATNPLLGETYIASTSGKVDVLTLPSTLTPRATINLNGPTSAATPGQSTSLQIESTFPLYESALATTPITITATAKSTGTSSVFASPNTVDTLSPTRYISGTFPTADTYTVVASFPGDSLYPAFTSPKVIVAVGTPLYSTSISVVATSSSATAGTATVTLSGSTYTPTGTLTIRDAATSNVLATYTIPTGGFAVPVSIAFTIPSGTTSITATYGGDSTNGSSTSAPVVISAPVVKSGTSLALTGPTGQPAPNTPFSTTVALASVNGKVPTGQVILSATPNGSSASQVGSATTTQAFGTGATISVSLPAGTYTLQASYAGDANFEASSSNSVTITVAASAPTANPGGPYSGAVGVAVAFNGSGSTDPNHLPLTYAWDFGDGLSATGVSPTHVYAQGGIFSVSLTVSNGSTSTSGGTSVTITTTPAASLAPASLTFNTPVGSTSALQDVVLTNTGGGSLTISSIVASGTGFTQVNGCPATLAAGAKCTIRVSFTPTSGGQATGAVTITDNATGSPHKITLTGTASGPVATVSPDTPSFGSFTVGTASLTPTTVFLQNTGTGTLTVASFKLDNIVDYEVHDSNCNAGKTLAAQAFCSVTVEFHPSAAGIRTATLQFTTSDTGSPQKAVITGNGLAKGVCTDQDGDKLCDDWENFGVNVRVNGVDHFIDLPSMGADPMHKDVFVHIDWMESAPSAKGTHTHQPIASAMAIVEKSFNDSPVTNPDGTTGIHLHIDGGPDCIMNPVTGALWGTMSLAEKLPEIPLFDPSSADISKFSWTSFDTNSADFKATGRGLVFHHAIFGHDLDTGPTYSGLSRNSADIGTGASDFVVTLGSVPGNPRGTAFQQAGTMMHELGHNLGLQHGGQDGQNKKPNYLSIMNYAFQMSGIIVNNDGKGFSNGLYDYSRFSLPDMDERALNEITGIAADPKVFPGTSAAFPAIDKYGTEWSCPAATGPGSLTYSATIDGPINWDCANGAGSPKVRVDTNGDGGLGVFTSFADWPKLTFSGGSVGGSGATTTEVAIPEFQADQVNTVLPPYRVEISGTSVLQTAPGTTIKLRFKVVNSGAIADSYTLTAGSPLGWASTTHSPGTLTLAPGASAVVTVSYTVPLGTTDGTSDRITLNAASQAATRIFDTAEALVYASTTPAPLSLSSTSATFFEQPLGSTGPTTPLILTNTGTGPLALTSISTSAQFTQTNDCGSTLAVGDSCMINLSFAPTAMGAQTGTLTITDSSTSSPEIIALKGTAIAAQLARSQISLTLSSTATITGRPVTFTATLAPVSGKVPTGTITFFNDSVNLGQATLDASGTATFTTSALAAGTYDIYAAYSGDAAFLTLTAPDQTLTITAAKATAVLLSSSLATATPGTSVTFTATISGGASGAQPGGTVQFLDGTTVIGTGTLNASAQATIAISTLGVGTHSITAQYAGDTVFAGSTSTALTQMIVTATTSTALTSSVTTAPVGTSVVLTATVTSNVGSPTGTVTFLDGSSAIGTGTLNGSGAATLTISTLAVGTHSITAQYAAAGIFPASVSSAKQVIITGTPDFSITNAPPSLTITRGSTGSVTFTVTPLNGYTGTLKFSCGTLPAYASCSFSPAQLAFTGGAQSPQTATLTLDTTARTMSMLKPLARSRPSFSLAGLFAFPGLGLGFLGLRRRKGSRRIALTLLFGLVALIGATALTGCGSHGAQLTPAGSYTIPVSVGDGTTSHTLNFSISVT